ncbi:MAG: hypothetical protein ACK5NQ_13810 [Pseudomonas sp.]
MTTTVAVLKSSASAEASLLAILGYSNVCNREQARSYEGKL